MDGKYGRLFTADEVRLLMARYGVRIAQEQVEARESGRRFVARDAQRVMDEVLQEWCVSPTGGGA